MLPARCVSLHVLLHTVARCPTDLELDDGAEEDRDAVKVLCELLTRPHLLDNNLGEGANTNIISRGFEMGPPQMH